jgi:hypothetical protein
MEEYGLISVEDAIDDGLSLVSNISVYNIHGKRLGHISAVQFGASEGMSYVDINGSPEIFGNTNIYIKPCKTCGEPLNMDDLCPICDNYLYDHQ